MSKIKSSEHLKRILDLKSFDYMTLEELNKELESIKEKLANCENDLARMKEHHIQPEK